MNFSQSHSFWLNLLFFFSCCYGGLCGDFAAMFFIALAVLLAAPSIPFLTVCFVLAILGVELSKVLCEMIVTGALLQRCLSSQKSQSSIGLMYSQLICCLSIRPLSCCQAVSVSRGVLLMIVIIITHNCIYKLSKCQWGPSSGATQDSVNYFVA